MSRKTCRLLSTAAVLLACGIPIGARSGDPFVWNRATMERATSQQVRPMVPYYPEGLVYADRILRKSIAEPLDLDLVLRIIPDESLADRRTEKTSEIFAHILSLHGDISRDDLWDIAIFSLEVFHGKLYAGMHASDPYHNSDGTLGTNDAFRRWLYVSESVPYGEGVSRGFLSGGLANAVLTMEGILPGVPRIDPGESPYGSPTRIMVQLRSAETEEELSDALFLGPDFTPHTYYGLAPGSSESVHDVVFQDNHRWVQYKVMMSTDDPRITPVLRKVELSASGAKVFSDTDWGQGGLVEQSDLFTLHSPGELVLANRKLGDGRTSMVRVLQPPGNEPPDLFYHLIFSDQSGERTFSKDRWPYEAVGDMEPYNGNLYLRVGPPVHFWTGAMCGDLVSYDYASGLFAIESPYYILADDPRNPTGVPMWGEGGGRITRMGDVLMDAQPDSKKGRWSGQLWMPAEEEQWYLYTRGGGDWRLGLIPAQIRGMAPIHIHNIGLFGDRYLFSTNAGVITREIPDRDSHHLDTGAWTYFDFGPPPTSASGYASAGFTVHQNLLIIGIHTRETAFAQLIYRMVILDGDWHVVTDKPISVGMYNALLRGGLRYGDRLYFWNGSDTLFFTGSEISPPFDLKGFRESNRSLLLVENLDILNWKADPANMFITTYRIYKVDGASRRLLGEVEPSPVDGAVHEFIHRGIRDHAPVRYAVIAVDDSGRESPPALIDIR